MSSSESGCAIVPTPTSRRRRRITSSDESISSDRSVRRVPESTSVTTPEASTSKRRAINQTWQQDNLIQHKADDIASIMSEPLSAVLIEWDDDRETDRILPELLKIKLINSGQQYDKLRIFSPSMFYDVTHDHMNLEGLIGEWLRNYQLDKNAQICELYQFFIDLMGLDYYKVTDAFNITDTNTSDVRPIFASLGVPKKVKPSFVANSTLWSRNMTFVLTHFINILIDQLYYTRLLDEVMKHLLVFLYYGIQSKVISVLHVSSLIGYIVVTKCTSMIKTLREESCLEIDLVTYFSEVTRFLLQRIHTKTRLHDASLYRLHMFGAQMMRKWVENAPEVVLTECDQFYNLAEFFLTINEGSIKTASLNSLMVLVSRNFKHLINPYLLKNLLQNIAVIVQDRNLKNCKLALDFHARSLAIYPSDSRTFISPNILCLAILSKHFENCSKPAVRYFVNLLRLDEITTRGFLVKCLTFLNELNNKMAMQASFVIIQGCENNIDEFRDFNTMFEIFHEEEEEGVQRFKKLHLAYLIKFSFKMCLLGYTGNKDQYRKTLHISKRYKRNLVLNVMPFLSIMIEEIMDEDILYCFLKIISYIECDQLKLHGINDCIRILPNSLCQIFLKSRSREIFEVIAKIYSLCLNVENEEIRQIFKNSNLVTQVVKLNNDRTTNVSEKSWTSQKMLNDITLSYMVRAIISDIDTELYYGIKPDWNGLIFEHSNQTVYINNMYCCVSYILWELEKMSKEMNVPKFKNDCKQLLEFLIKPLTTNLPVAPYALSCILRFYKITYIKLPRVCNNDVGLQNLLELPKIDSSTVTLGAKIILANVSSECAKMLKVIYELIRADYICFNDVSLMFKHPTVWEGTYKEETYGMLTKMRAHNSQCACVVTLIDLVEDYHNSKLTNTSVKAAVKLMYEYFKLKKISCEYLWTKLIDYVASKPHNSKILQFAEIFIERIDREKSKDIATYISRPIFDKITNLEFSRFRNDLEKIIYVK